LVAVRRPRPSGITAASISTGFAYVADVTPPRERAARFGLLGVASGAASCSVPRSAGSPAVVDPRLPFWIAAGLEPCERALLAG
jgi:DHA1 family tetracycline resistance protein-like MFS transporter